MKEVWLLIMLWYGPLGEVRNIEIAAYVNVELCEQAIQPTLHKRKASYAQCQRAELKEKL